MRKYNKILNIVSGLINYRIMNHYTKTDTKSIYGIVYIVSNYARNLLLKKTMQNLDGM